jgi:hypothetical protein
MTCGFRGGPDRDRTDYLRHAMAALYQVSYGPGQSMLTERFSSPRAHVWSFEYALRAQITERREGVSSRGPRRGAGLAGCGGAGAVLARARPRMAARLEARRGPSLS